MDVKIKTFVVTYSEFRRDAEFGLHTEVSVVRDKEVAYKMLLNRVKQIAEWEEDEELVNSVDFQIKSRNYAPFFETYYESDDGNTDYVVSIELHNVDVEVKLD